MTFHQLVHLPQVWPMGFRLRTCVCAHGKEGSVRSVSHAYRRRADKLRFNAYVLYWRAQFIRRPSGSGTDQRICSRFIWTEYEELRVPPSQWYDDTNLAYEIYAECGAEITDNDDHVIVIRSNTRDWPSTQRGYPMKSVDTTRLTNEICRHKVDKWESPIYTRSSNRIQRLSHLAVWNKIFPLSWTFTSSWLKGDSLTPLHQSTCFLWKNWKLGLPFCIIEMNRKSDTIRFFKIRKFQ